MGVEIIQEREEGAVAARVEPVEELAVDRRRVLALEVEGEARPGDRVAAEPRDDQFAVNARFTFLARSQPRVDARRTSPGVTE